MTQNQDLPDIRMDSSTLYREETISDRQVGTIRKLVPVTADGADDASRQVIFEGSASLMTPGGALPLHFELQADSLSEALDKFPEAAQQALKDTVEQLEKLRREQQSSIVVPGGTPQGGPAGMGPAGGGFGGLRG